MKDIRDRLDYVMGLVMGQENFLDNNWSVTVRKNDNNEDSIWIQEPVKGYFVDNPLGLVLTFEEQIFNKGYAPPTLCSDVEITDHGPSHTDPPPKRSY